MRYLVILFAGLLFFGCKRQSYQNQDIHYMAGTWKKVKVISESEEKTKNQRNLLVDELKS